MAKNGSQKLIKPSSTDIKAISAVYDLSYEPVPELPGPIWDVRIIRTGEPAALSRVRLSGGV